VTRRESGFHVRDLGSTNGTYHGALRVFEAEVPLNTVLRLGEAELCFEPVSQPGQLPAHGLIGKEPAMRHAVELLERIAPSQVTVMLQPRPAGRLAPGPLPPGPVLAAERAAADDAAAARAALALVAEPPGLHAFEERGA
jgi:hypothetical protein